MVQKGFNSEMHVKGLDYQIQTEDWGFENPYVVTRVFCAGAVIKTIKTSYLDLAKAADPQFSPLKKLDANTIHVAMKKQHNHAIEGLSSR